MSPDHTEPLSIARRSVLRTAAHAAWAVPAISVVAAAPAFASSPGTQAPFGAFTFTSGWERITVSDVSVDYSPEPWAAGSLYLTFRTAGSYQPVYDLSAQGAWVVDGPQFTSEPRFVYTGPITSKTLLAGEVSLSKAEFVDDGTLVTATLGNADGTVAYAQDSVPLMGWMPPPPWEWEV